MMAVKRFFVNIRSRILLLLGVTFVVVLGLMGHIAYLDRERDLAEATEAVQQTAERIARQQSEIVKLTQQLLSLLTQVHDFRELGSMPRCQQLLAQILTRESALVNVMVASPDGSVICNATATEHLITISDRAYFQRALASPNSVIGEAAVGRSTGKWSLPFAKAVRDDAGQVKVILVLSLDLQWVAHELSKAKLSASANLGLIDSKGTILVNEPDPEKLTSKSVADTPLFKHLIAHGGSGTAEEIGADNEWRIFGFAHFADTAAGPIYLWVGISKEAVWADVEREYLSMMLEMLIALSLSFGAIWIGSERLFLRPLRVMADTARRLGQGDHRARTSLQYTNDELGHLERSIDEMATALMSRNEIFRLNRALRALSNCNAVMVHASDEPQMLRDMCRNIVEVAGYHLVWVGYAEHDANKTVRPVAHAGYDDGYMEQANISWADNKQGSGPAGIAIRTRRPCVIQDAQADPTYAPWRDNAVRIGYHSVVGFPLVSNGEVLGALCIYSSEATGFDAGELRLLGELADDLAFGIVALRTRAEEAQGAMRLTKSMGDTILALGAVVEMRDPYTAGHQRRVAELSVAIAREIGLTDNDVMGIEFAADIHDLGKIQVPAEILAKPSKLTNIEFSLIKTHPQAGYDILKNIDFPWPIAQMVYQHHERLDGSGYPQQLKDAAILIGARILAVADTVEAMASHRPYRPGLGIDAALAEITKNRGKVYDATVVDACVRLFDEKRFSFPA
jgi:HD-GYP domain-containing protein (c-di-GMP phosphodiesterase class II)